MNKLFTSILFLVFFLSNAVSQDDSKNNWQVLIPEIGLDGWHYYQDKKNNKTGWSNKKGILTFNSSFKKGNGDNSLVTDKQFTNFKIYFEWKVDSLTNSGFMWGVKEGDQYEEPYVTGPEIQIMDNEYPDGVKAGSLYGMVYPEEDMSKPVGEWNSYLITIDYKNNFGNVIFNGKEVVNFPVEGEEWDSMVAGTKFANCDEKPWDNCEFGKFKSGKICLQDHGGSIYFRNNKKCRRHEKFKW